MCKVENSVKLNVILLKLAREATARFGRQGPSSGKQFGGAAFHHQEYVNKLDKVHKQQANITKYLSPLIFYAIRYAISNLKCRWNSPEIHHIHPCSAWASIFPVPFRTSIFERDEAIRGYHECTSA
jgi:hypothetical protein